MKRSILIFMGIIAILITILATINIIVQENRLNSVKSFEDCVRLNLVIQETSPRRCIVNGKEFIEHKSASNTANTGAICIDKCGDKTCQDIVCQGESCPCQEDVITCPIDCKTKQSEIRKNKYEDNLVEFEYPEEYKVERFKQVDDKSETYYFATLGIDKLPEEQYLTYSKTALKNMRPNSDLISEIPFAMGGKQGFKWTRAFDKYIILDYFTTAKNNLGSIGLRVKIQANDTRLQETLDEIAHSIKVKD